MAIQPQEFCHSVYESAKQIAKAGGRGELQAGDLIRAVREYKLPDGGGPTSEPKAVEQFLSEVHPDKGLSDTEVLEKLAKIYDVAMQQQPKSIPSLRTLNELGEKITSVSTGDAQNIARKASKRFEVVSRTFHSIFFGLPVTKTMIERTFGSP